LGKWHIERFVNFLANERYAADEDIKVAHFNAKTSQMQSPVRLNPKNRNTENEVLCVRPQKTDSIGTKSYESVDFSVPLFVPLSGSESHPF
jgi:hypothetical protein